MTRGKPRGVLLCGVAALLALAGAGWVLRDVLWAGWWVLRLEHGDLETRRRAVEELGRRPTAFAIPHLVEAASEQALRAAVHESLVRSGPSAVPRLVAALGMASPDGRRAAAEALRKMEIDRGARIAVEAWFVAEGAGPEKTEALRVLSMIGPLPDSAIDLIAAELNRLRRASSDSDYIAANRALEAQGPRSVRALPPLFECLLHENAYYPLRAILAVGAPAGALLEKELSSEDPHRRMSAADTLVKLGGPFTRKGVPVLIAALKDRAQHARGAAQSLGLVGPDALEAAPALIEAMGDPDWDVSFHASQALGSLGPEAVPALVKLLGSPGTRRRRLALGALEEMESEALWAGQALRDALEDGESGIRTRAAAILAKLGSPADLTLPHLLAGLDSTESHVKWRARESIAALAARSFECKARLRALVEDSLDDEVRRWSLFVLERVKDGSEILEPALEAVVAANPYEIDSAGALLEIRSSPVNLQRVLEHLRSPYRKVQLAALRTIRERRITVPEVVAEVVSILEQPEVMKDAGRAKLDHDNLLLPALRALEALGLAARPGARALETIARTGTSEQRLRAGEVLHAIEPRPALVVRPAIEILEDRQGWSDGVGYRGSTTHHLFAEAARLVGSLGAAGAEAEAPLRAALVAESFTTRVAAACALWRLTGKAEEPLAVFLQDAGKRWMAWFERPASILDWFPPGPLGTAFIHSELHRVLAEMGQPAVEALVPFLEHERHEVRVGACHRLADIGDAALSAMPALCARLRDRDIRVALAASDAIEKLRPEDPGCIVALLGDRDPPVAVRAGRLLLRLRGTQTLPEVQALLDRDDTREPASFLLEALEPGTGARLESRQAARSPPQSVETLLSRLAEPSVDGRLQAIEELGRHGPAAAAAVPLLLEAIDDDDEAAAEEAIRALGRIRSDAGRVVPALVRVFKVEALRKHHEVADGALMAYGSEAVPFVLPELHAALEEGDGNVFHLSWFALLERAGTSAAPAVPDLCRAVPAIANSPYREQAVRLLGAIGPAAAEAVPRLEEVIRNHNESPSMLGAAWVALERIRGRQP